MTAPYRKTRMLLTAVLASYAGIAFADIQPTGATQGVRVDNPEAGLTRITAPDNAIIDYARFNVGVGETVQFIQPGATSRVLNRINSSTPSQINGTLTANGIVYLVNPAGVQFGPNSVVDAAGLFAAAASLSNSDFLSGVNQFNRVSGDITTRGIIRADTLAALIGKSVTNTGTIAVPNGTVVMASGDDVLLGSPRGGVMVQVTATPRADGQGGVNQDGTVQAANLSLVSGDLASLAMNSNATAQQPSGTTPNVTIDQIDTDGDGDIDNDDINTAYLNFTGPQLPGAFNKTQQQGDTDGDGDVDNTDIATLFIYFTGPKTTPPTPPADPPVAGDFNLRVVEDFEPTPITEEVNLTEADLDILRSQLGIFARQPVAKERIEKLQARGFYNDFRDDGPANPDSLLTIANTRLDADVVRKTLALYRERILVQGVSPAQRVTQVQAAVELAYAGYTDAKPAGEAFSADAFCSFVQENNPELLRDLNALDQMLKLALNMGLSEREKNNSEQAIINRTKPEALGFDQMKATLKTAGAIPLEPTPTDAG